MKIAIADDHSLILTGFAKLIETERPDINIFTAENKLELFEILDKENIHILFQDIKFGRSDAREFIKTIKNDYPSVRIIVISTLIDEQTVDTLFNQGIHGYVSKSDDPDEILKAIEAVSNGESYHSKDIVENRSTYSSRKSSKMKLTPREKEVLSAIIDGKTIKETANDLFLSEKTIESYRSNLFLKFDVNNVAGLVKKAILEGYL